MPRSIFVLFFFLSLLFFVPFGCSIIPESQCDKVASMVAEAARLLCASKDISPSSFSYMPSEYVFVVQADTIRYSIEQTDSKISVSWQSTQGDCGKIVALR